MAENIKMINPLLVKMITYDKVNHYKDNDGDYDEKPYKTTYNITFEFGMSEGYRDYITIEYDTEEKAKSILSKFNFLEL